MQRFIKGLLFTLPLLLTGCKPALGAKITITKSSEVLETFIELDDKSAVTNLISAEANFVLVSYALVGCSCWGQFHIQVLNPYISETNIPIYVLHTDLFNNEYYGLPINAAKTNTPVIGLYKEGVYTYGLNYFEDEAVFAKLATFKTWINRYIMIV